MLALAHRGPVFRLFNCSTTAVLKLVNDQLNELPSSEKARKAARGRLPPYRRAREPSWVRSAPRSAPGRESLFPGQDSKRPRGGSRSHHLPFGRWINVVEKAQEFHLQLTVGAVWTCIRPEGNQNWSQLARRLCDFSPSRARSMTIAMIEVFSERCSRGQTSTYCLSIRAM